MPVELRCNIRIHVDEPWLAMWPFSVVHPLRVRSDVAVHFMFQCPASMSGVPWLFLSASGIGIDPDGSLLIMFFLTQWTIPPSVIITPCWQGYCEIERNYSRIVSFQSRIELCAPDCEVSLMISHTPARAESVEIRVTATDVLNSTNQLQYWFRGHRLEKVVVMQFTFLPAYQRHVQCHPTSNRCKILRNVMNSAQELPCSK